MPTSYDTNLHFLAKKAKNRLAGRDEETQSDYNKYMKRVNETYMTILRMTIKEDIVYNPIAIYLGKDLKSLPDSSEKVRTVLETSSYVSEVKKMVKADMIKKTRTGEPVIVDGVEYDPSDILRRLH
ncbi:MAG: hypothetical protein K2O86_06240 [Clostridia bacterium]|jgi:hypothetical protein|nr:hypothetical protein [Clostridia bacterium]MDE7071555.1 hypothetical protein [Clostridia bacterium]